MCNCFSKNLGLGAAAKKDVGTGAGQIPDMSSWLGGGSTEVGWRKTPDGFIEQWGRSAATVTSVDIFFSIPFPNGVIEMNEHDTGGGQKRSVWQINNLSNTGCSAENIGSLNGGAPDFLYPVPAACRWFAKGK